MAVEKKLISESEGFRRYEYRDGSKLICVSDEPVLTAEQEREQAIRSKAIQALQANAAFLAKPTPTNAEVVAQVKLLTRECNALIRLVLNQLDTDDA